MTDHPGRASSAATPAASTRPARTCSPSRERRGFERQRYGSISRSRRCRRGKTSRTHRRARDLRQGPRAGRPVLSRNAGFAHRMSHFRMPAPARRTSCAAWRAPSNERPWDGREPRARHSEEFRGGFRTNFETTWEEDHSAMLASLARRSRCRNFGQRLYCDFLRPARRVQVA